MDKTIENFKQYWRTHYGYVEQVLTDREISLYLDECGTLEMACEMAYDYVLSQGLAEVQP